MARFSNERFSVETALPGFAFITALKDLHASSEDVVTSVGSLGSLFAGGTDFPARVRNRLAIWSSAWYTSSFLAADACSSSRRSPVRQFLARRLSTYSLPRLVIEPSTTAELPVLSQISDATAGVSFASGARTIRRSVSLMRASESTLK